MGLLAAGAAFGANSRPEKLRVAVIQFAESPNLDATRDRMVSWINRAADREARVVVFPEGALGIPETATEAAKPMVANRPTLIRSSSRPCR